MGLVDVQLEAGGPITQMDDALLVRSQGSFDDEVETTKWVEYRVRKGVEVSDLIALRGDRAVHRSVDVILKKPAVFADGTVSSF